MKEIKQTDYSSTFVGKLNDNFNDAGSGGGGSSSSIERTVNVQMQGGMIVDGYTRGNIGSSYSSYFMRYCHSVLMMNIEGCEIKSVATETGETLTIFYYGASGAYVGSVSSISNIPSSACYVKFMLQKSSAYTSIRTLSVTIEGNPRFVKNDVPTRVVPKYVSFETTMPTRLETTSDDTDKNTYIGNNTRYWDNGFVRLPPNYTVDGKPVPLVISVHGTNGYTFSSGIKNDGSGADYNSLQEFVVNNGYAMCDCSGLTNSFANAGNAYAAPSYAVSIVRFVKFLTENYNIRTDGVYIYGKSSGGFMTHYLAHAQTLKVRAAAGLAPALSPMVSLPLHLYNSPNTVSVEAGQIGITGTIPSTRDDFFNNNCALVLNHINLWRQIDPFFMGTDLTDEQVETIVDAVYESRTSNTNENTNISTVSAATAILNNAKRYVHCPTKIWIAEDDGTVHYGNSKLFVEMAHRGDSPCYLRSLPRNTGAHHAVDTHANAIKTTYQTKYGGSVQVPVAYAEMVDWFNRW